MYISGQLLNVILVVFGLLVGHELKRLDANGQAESQSHPSAYLLTSSPQIFFRARITSAGYRTETMEQLQEALKSQSAPVRWSALYVLGYQNGQEAIPLLREGLQDEDVLVRVHATRVLGALGDRSGVPVLRRDLAELAPRNGAPDPNMKQLEGKELERAKRQRHQRLSYALRAAGALSELGDPNGLELAARMALTSEYAGNRSEAFQVLVNLSRCDPSVLSGLRTDPLSVLIAAAGSETNPDLLSALKAGAARLPDSKAKLLYEKLVASPHITDEDRTTIQGRIKAIETTMQPSKP